MPNMNQPMQNFNLPDNNAMNMNLMPGMNAAGLMPQ